MPSSPSSHALIEQAIISSQHALDQRRFDLFADYFALDGKLYRPTSDVPLVGRNEIRTSYEKTPRDRINRHLVSNISISLEGDYEARALSYVVLYSAEQKTHDKPVFGYNASRCLLGEFHDMWVYQLDRWLIGERKAVFTINTTESNNQ